MCINNMFRVYGVSEGDYVTDNNFMMHPDGYLIRLVDGIAVKQDPLLYKVERAAVLRQDRVYFHNDVVDITDPSISEYFEKDTELYNRLFTRRWVIEPQGEKWRISLVKSPEDLFSMLPGISCDVPDGCIFEFVRTIHDKEDNDDAAMPKV
ncbi:MAG: hypothetical protein WC279_14065 [Sulfurimonas sp.]|uniref:hypothetical protein n=1 Tax=Sulfurimonas sp. TaxID=2022749 RepID=UPI0035616133